MHDTARCLGYPSDSSWTARKRLGSQLSGASPLSFSRSPFLCSFADAHRRHLPHRFGRLVRPAVQHSSLPPGGLPRRPLGSRGRCPGPITLLRLLGRSAVCTGSPVAGDCGGFGITGPYAVRIPSSESRGPSGRRAFKLGGHRACLQSVGPRAQSAARGPPWPGPGPALRGRCGVAAGASSAAAARLGRRGPGRSRAAGLGRGQRAGPGLRAGSHSLPRQSQVSHAFGGERSASAGSAGLETPCIPALGVKPSFCIAAFKRLHLRRCCS